MEENLRAKIIARAWKDQRFKQLLLKNPKEAFREMGVKVDKNLDVKVIEDKPNSMTFVLPPTPGDVNALNDEELGKVAGGLCTSFPKSIF